MNFIPNKTIFSMNFAHYKRSALTKKHYEDFSLKIAPSILIY